ncbi:MAG: glycoside hydrolase family 127 protein [Clostridia bacterium]|nr:glycoside hydrolase family 127 protein [Clostridia bacterium]
MKDKYSFFTTKEIKPQGWLRRQIELQAKGLCGNLDKVWPDIRDSAWIGGCREGWERVPYWLDGFIPMAYLLDDEDMKARAKRYIDKIIENQQDDGWICPNGNTPRDKYDTWAVSLISKVLTVYYECSGDERVPAVVYKVLKNYYELLSNDSIKLFGWGKFRWFECFVALRFVKGYYPAENWMDELARLLKEQGADYESFTDMWQKPVNHWDFRTHIVNLAMMFKYEAISAGTLGDEYRDVANKLYRFLRKRHGNVTGFLTGDECLSGKSPIQGTELCAVVEMMYSCEWLYACTGDSRWADLLELQAFNALPATISDDMWAHQYDQMSNQIECAPIAGNPPFGTNGASAHVFGLEPNYGCCTANFGQGWPKLALSAFMKADDGVVCVTAIPSEVSFDHKGAHLCVSLETDYPFKNNFVYKIYSDRKTSAKLRVRIPQFAKNVYVNGELVSKKNMLIFGGFDVGETIIRLSFDVDAELKPTPAGLLTARRGSLLFALPIQYETNTVEYMSAGVERKFPYCDYHYFGKSDWNFGFASDLLTVKENDVSDIPFSADLPAVTLTAELCHIDWGYEPRYDSICAAKPERREALDDPQKTMLVPYGAAKLRMTEMPKVKFK